MIYLFLGNNPELKKKKIAEIKDKVLENSDANQFDYDLLHAAKLDPDSLKQSLIVLPTVAKKRLVVVRQIDKLTDQHKRIVLDFIEENNDQTILILDSDLDDLNNAFTKKVSAKAQVFNVAQGKQKNVFDMTRAISSRNPVEALRILSQLLASGNHPLQIMGGLVWFWGKSKQRLTADRFKKGLHVLQQADYNIKRSRIEPQYALETLVLKLSSIIAY